MHNIKAIICWV